MSRVGSVSISLSDVFSVLPTPAAPVTVVTPASEPKSRGTTIESESSKASSVSTIKNVPVGGSVVSHHQTPSVHHVETHHYDAPPVTAPRYELPPSTGDDLLDSVFAAVPLPTVELREPSHHHHGVHVDDHYQTHDDAIRHIDDVLDGEDTDEANDHESVVSEPHYRAPSSHASSHVSSHARKSDYASEHHPQYTNSVHTNGSIKVTAPHVPQPDYYDAYEDEHHDHFNTEHQFAKKQESTYRSRSNTIDSSLSLGESRFGDFNVHDESDKFTGSTLNIYHDEVAYERPQSTIYSTSNSVASIRTNQTQTSYHSGGTYKLKQMQRQVEEAKAKKTTLANQVDRERAEVERLRQGNLAREASLKVNRIGHGGHPIVAHSVGSYSTDTSSYHERADSYSHRSAKSVDSSIYDEEEVKTSVIAAKQKAAGETIAVSGKYELIVPQYHVVQNFSSNNKINKVVIGGEAAETAEDKTILLFGPVGSGKTSTVASMINYLYDVKKENEFRFVLDEHVNSTSGLTAYVFHNTILPYNVTVVDTPGVVDQINNKTVSKLIKQWFQKELLEDGAFRLDAISIVLRHDENQLGWPFIYELADIKKIFGDDLKTNVLPIITNSEVLPQPIAIKSLAQANISFMEYYKVNNAGFFVQPHGVSKLQHNLFWTHGVASLENLFRDLQELIHPLIAILRHNKGQKVEQSPALAHATLY